MTLKLGIRHNHGEAIVIRDELEFDVCSCLVCQGVGRHAERPNPDLLVQFLARGLDGILKANVACAARLGGPRRLGKDLCGVD